MRFGWELIYLFCLNLEGAAGYWPKLTEMDKIWHFLDCDVCVVLWYCPDFRQFPAEVLRQSPSPSESQGGTGESGVAPTLPISGIEGFYYIIKFYLPISDFKTPKEVN